MSVLRQRLVGLFIHSDTHWGTLLRLHHQPLSRIAPHTYFSPFSIIPFRVLPLGLLLQITLFLQHSFPSWAPLHFHLLPFFSLFFFLILPIYLIRKKTIPHVSPYLLSSPKFSCPNSGFSREKENVPCNFVINYLFPNSQNKTKLNRKIETYTFFFCLANGFSSQWNPEQSGVRVLLGT